MTENSKTIDRNDPEGAAGFNDVACNVFAPIYPVIAEQAMNRCGVHEGVGVDLGCGPALLAVAMAKITDIIQKFQSSVPDHNGTSQYTSAERFPTGQTT
ncbi:MAG: hypothetical protein JRE28_13195 [Deltaproteobacteria bacterium]|nr:hypothetical protein [Deltaproteobacteria bacterium]